MARPSQEEATQRLLAAIDAFSETAYGSDTDDELASSRALSIERYLGKNINPAPVGRSQVRDRTTFEVVEWTKPSLLRIFTSGAEVCKFDPQGPEDEELAQQESDYTNYVVTQRNNWHQICNDWISDGLLLKNGYCYAYWDNRQAVESEKYENLTDDSFAFLAQDKEIEVVGHSQRPNEAQDERNQQAYQRQMQAYEQQMQQMQMQPPPPPQPGQPPQPPPQLPPPPQPPPPTFLHDVELRRTKKRGSVKFCVIPPERTLVDINAGDHTLAGADYFEFFDYKTIGALRAEGLDVPDDIGDAGEDDRDGSVELARDRFNESTWSEEGTFADPSMRRVRVRYIWIRHDYDGDGINELQYAIVVGNEILFREECEEIPVASWSPIPMAHRHVGMSLADSVDDIEEINTDLTRQAINNINLANTPRIAASDRVNMADLLDVRVGGVVRVEGQPPQEIMPLTVPNIFGQAVEAISFFDSRRQNRTGINAYFQGTDSNVLNKTASGISQLTNSAAQRVETIGRYFASAVERLFLITHRLILQHGHAEEVVRLRNRWVAVDPAQWRKRNDVKIAVGLGTGNKDSLLQQLSMMFQTQMAAAQFGVVDPPNIYATLMEMAKAASFTTPERFATDPATKPPPQPPPPPPQIIVEQMRQQGDQQKMQMDAQMEQMRTQVNAQTQTQLEQMRLAFQKWKEEYDRETQLMLEQIRAQKDVELENRRIGSAEGMKMVEYQRADAEKQTEVDRDSLVEDVHRQSSELMQAVQALLQSTEGKKVVAVEKVKDPRTGRLAVARVRRADGSSDEITIQ